MKWTDDTIFPWGAHKGVRAKDVPPAYLMWLLKQRWIVDWPDLHAYLLSNRQRLESSNAEPRDHDSLPEIMTYEDYLKDYRGY